MALYRAFLVMLLLAALPAYDAFSTGQSACVACHRPHQVCQGACVSCHRGDDRTERKEIAHHDLVAGRFAHYHIEGSPVVERGKKLINGLACRRCHRYEKKGNPLAVSLDLTGVAGKARNIHHSIRDPALYMPDFHLNDIQIATLVNAILARGKFTSPPVNEIPIAIHFMESENIQGNVFTLHCGKCHKLLSEKFGGLGSSNAGPNLSGLFSGFYPWTYGNAEPWDTERLKKWLDNPLDINKNALMQPVRLKPGEREQLLQSFLPDRR